jgi:hypothetical protein
MEKIYAYLAGVLDTDGFIHIACRRGTEHYFARIGFSDESPVLPELFQEIFKGRLSRSRPKRSSYSAFYLWEVDHRQAREPLSRLLPHLKVKHRQAELALMLMDILEREDAGRPVGTPLSTQHAAERRRLYEEVVRLNSARRRRKHRVEAPPR